jgi:hypothetical protein
MAGFILEFTGSYLVLFVICGSIYILAYLIFIRLAPRLEQMEI